MHNERDFDARPYTADELRVVEYLHKIAPEIGAGDDPIGFLIASHAAFQADCVALNAQVDALVLESKLPNGDRS